MNKQKLTVPALLSILFASIYLAVGPGCFFSVDEVLVQEMSQAVMQRGTLEVPAMNATARGRAEAYYAHKGPLLGFVALPFVAAGNFLDDRFGSLDGGAAAGPPRGTLEHPLRWGGRLAIFSALGTNAVAGGLCIAVLYLILLQMGATHRIALILACTVGTSTLLASESTHFFQHPLETLFLLLGFYFFSLRNAASLASRAFFGGLSLALAILTRPNSVPAATIILVYGALVAWKNTPSLHRAAIMRAGFLSILPLMIGSALYLYYNFIQFGSFFDFGYHRDFERFQFSAAETVRAIAAYLASPSLSIFLFAPPLVLALASAREAFERWPLEASVLISASFAHLLLITFFGAWHGDLSYGPRYMLAPIVLLMPLSIPAFERAFPHRSAAWRTVVIGLIALGICIQLVGILVFVTANEWYRVAHRINENGAFVFVPAASSFLVNARELLAWRNIIPWSFRALANPGPSLLFLLGLALLIALSCWKLRKSNDSMVVSQLPWGIAFSAASLVAVGFFVVRPVTTSAGSRADELLQIALSAQAAGQDVKAQEYYAIVIGLNRENKGALRNLAKLYEKNGMKREAALLNKKAATGEAASNPPVSVGALQFRTPREFYDAGKRFWDANNKHGALVIWQAGATLFPAEVSLIRNVALARYATGDYEGAASDYKRASGIAPADSSIKTDLAWALLKLNKHQEAREICLQVLAAEPNNGPAKTIFQQLE